ncbi:hypothetical protein HNR74_004993 [Flammeovirga kamogawensis]|nr:hypothetical protein [Flammeovirga kamogawensis]
MKNSNLNFSLGIVGFAWILISVYSYIQNGKSINYVFIILGIILLVSSFLFQTKSK